MDREEPDHRESLEMTVEEEVEEEVEEVVEEMVEEVEVAQDLEVVLRKTATVVGMILRPPTGR